MAKYVLFYESNDNISARAREHFPAHQAWYQRFAQDGSLIAIGILEDPQQNGAMAVFTTREDAQRFVEGDPFVLNGVVRAYRILEWNEVLLDRPST